MKIIISYLRRNYYLVKKNKNFILILFGLFGFINFISLLFLHKNQIMIFLNLMLFLMYTQLIVEKIFLTPQEIVMVKKLNLQKAYFISLFFTLILMANFMLIHFTQLKLIMLACLIFINYFNPKNKHIL